LLAVFLLSFSAPPDGGAFFCIKRRIRVFFCMAQTGALDTDNLINYSYLEFFGGSMSYGKFAVRNMTRDEMDIAVGWAACEGWNPGINDADCFYRTDPDGFFVAASDEGPLGFISAVRYGGDFGFIGFFVVRPDLRGGRLGPELGRAALTRLAGVNTGIDGVLNKVKNYETYGFRMAHHNVRYCGVRNAGEASLAQLESVSSVAPEELSAFDRRFFPVARQRFLRLWLKQPASHSFIIKKDGVIQGLGVIRRCLAGYKIGPLFAEDETSAERLFCGLAARVPEGEKFYMDIPQPNVAALAMARRHAMTPVFETARMYSGHDPQLPLDRIYGITSFELG